MSVIPNEVLRMTETARTALDHSSLPASLTLRRERLWQLPALPAPLHTAFTTRNGGVSTAPYDGQNLGLHVGDNPQNVRENRARAFSALNLDPARVVIAQQIHGDMAALVTKNDAGRGSFSHADTIEGADALVTREKNLPLVVLNADCLLFALGDPHARVLGVLHAGWRGMAAGILENTLALMVECGADPARIHAVGSPSIGPCCFEVGGDVVEALGSAHVVSRDGEKAQYDFRAAASERLVRAGVARANVAIDAACTCCSPEDFFSHRRATHSGKSRTGRMALIAWMA
jgi:polyphenol oxidase